MRIMITGGAGFIGSNLAHHLHHLSGQGNPKTCCSDHDRYADLAPPRNELVEILNVDKLTYAGDLANLDGVANLEDHTFEQADICDAGAMDTLVSAFEPEAIVHLAAESHVDRSIDDGTAFVETNVLGTQILLDAARRHDIERFVHVSTDEVYGSIREGSFTEKDDYDPSSPYAASKAGSDLLVKAHHETYGQPVTITRCTNNYGPRQHPEKLVPKMITLAVQDEPLPIYGDGSNVRDWLYVKDHCQALLTVLDSASFEAEIYNVAARQEHPNLEVVKTLLEQLEKPESLIEFVKDRPGHDFRYSLDDSKLRKLGWGPRTSFPKGIRETVTWFSS